MRRPVLLFCLAEAAGIFSAYYLNYSFFIIFVCLNILLLIFIGRFSFIPKELRGLVAAVLFFLLFGAFLMFSAKTAVTEAELRAGQVTQISGTVVRAHRRDDYSALVVKSNDVGGLRGTEKVLVRLRSDADVYDLVGRCVTLAGEVSLPEQRRNPGCFDYRRYLKGQGIHAVCEVSRFRFEAGPVRLRALHALSVIKGRFLESAADYLDEEELSLLAGILFGEKEYMAEDLYDSFKKNGIAHVLAVSGLHVGLLYSLVIKILDRKDLKTGIVIVFCLAVYVALADFSVSSMRAALMIFLHLAAFYLKRRYDMVSAASLAAIIMLSFSPYRIFDAGTQLSFTAAYTLGVALPWAELKLLELSDKYKKSWILSAGRVAAPCVMIQLGMVPLMMFHFLNFSLTALLLNPPVIFIAGILMPAGLALFIVFALSGGFPLLMALAAGPVGASVKLMLLLNRLGTAAGASYEVPAPPFGMTALWYLAFFWGFSEVRHILYRRGRYPLLAASASLLVAAGTFCPRLLGITHTFIPWSYGLPAVTFVDVGQGDCIHIHCRGTDMLIDGGGSHVTNIAERTLKDYLLHNGVTRIELAAATHMDNDHYLGLEQLSEIFKIEEFALPGTFAAGDRIALAPDVFLDVLWPPVHVDPDNAENEESLVVMLRYSGVDILLTGDLGEEGEKALLITRPDPETLDCDVLKAGHHGSRYSSSEVFLAAVKPEAAVISCGFNNSYGHPHAETLERLAACGADVWRTDTGGAVTVRISGWKKYIIENLNGAKTVYYCYP